MSKKQTSKFRRRKRVIPAVLTAAAFAATVAAPASALTPAASAASQVAQAATSSSASSSSTASQTSSETSNAGSRSVASSSTASNSAAFGSTTSSRTSSAVSAPSSESQTLVQEGSSSTSSATSSQAPQTAASASSSPKLKDSNSDFDIQNGVLVQYTGQGGAVTIPSSVTSIGDGAFSWCTSLTSVTISSGVTSIGDEVFYQCTSLTNVTIPSSVTSIGAEAFSWCTSLTSVTIPSSVTSIQAQTFVHCTNLTSVTIPSSVTSIEDDAFSWCTSLTSVTIPSSVTSIEGAFGGCTSLTNISVDSSNTIYSSIDGVLFNKNKDTLILCPVGRKGSYNIPSGITSIGDNAFYQCTSLTSITIPSSVTSIGNDAFYWCTSLTSVTISSGVTSIGNNAFSGCTSLTSVTIPSSVTSIGVWAFDTSDIDHDTVVGKLQQITVDPANPDFSSVDGVLFNKNEDTLIQYPGGKTGSYTIPSSVTSIGDHAFEECNLTSVTIPSNVTSIGTYTFVWCTGLTNVTIPSSVTNIGEAAFQFCTNLTNVTISSGVTSIGDWALNGCDSLTSVTIPSSVTSIGDDSLADDNSNLTLTVDSGSYAEAYAQQHNIKYVLAGNTPTTPAAPLTDIDAPADGSSVNGTVNVSGWVLNASGINRVDVYAYDSNGTAHSLGSVASKDLTNRGDVAKAFANAGYANIATSGYSLPVDTTQLSSGTYTLAVAGIGNDGVVQWATKTINVTTPQPLTDIDVPADGSSVNGTVNVSGWALNVSGINRVDVYAFDSNGQPHSLGSVASKNLTGRSDVAGAFANDGYANIATSGYSLPVDTTKLAGGTYTLAVAGIGNNGVVQWATKTINVTTPQPLTDIDAPADGSSVNGTVNVSGWALNVSGINRVDVYAWDSNGKPHSLGSVASKDLTGRSDVAGAFANDGYANIATSGYSLPVDTTQLSSGTYTLAVAGIGNNDVVQWATKTINVTTPQPLTDIDAPADGSSVNGTVNVSGWALNVSGIDRVDVYAWDSNGTPHTLGSVASKDLADRADVASAFANDGYGNINNSGYTLPVDTTKLAGGTYTLAVAGIGNNGVVQWATKIIKVQ